MNRSAPCQSTFRYVVSGSSLHRVDSVIEFPVVCNVKDCEAHPSQLTTIYLHSADLVRALPTSSTPFVDKENQQESHIVQIAALRSSAGKINPPWLPLGLSGFASSPSSSLKRKSASSTFSPRASFACALPTLGNQGAGDDGERAATPSECAVRQAAGTLVELKRPMLGSNLLFNESDEDLPTAPCPAQPSPRGEFAHRPLPPRSLNPVARTLWNGGREVECDASAHAVEGRGTTRGSEESLRVVRKKEGSSSSVSHTTASAPSPLVSDGRPLQPMGLATAPPGIDGRFVVRPQPKRLRLASTY
jgi:hypothetical protein